MSEVRHARNVLDIAWCGEPKGDNSTNSWSDCTCIPCLEQGREKRPFLRDRLSYLIDRLKSRVPDLEGEAWDD